MSDVGTGGATSCGFLGRDDVGVLDYYCLYLGCLYLGLFSIGSLLGFGLLSLACSVFGTFLLVIGPPVVKALPSSAMRVTADFRAPPMLASRSSLTTKPQTLVNCPWNSYPCRHPNANRTPPTMRTLKIPMSTRSSQWDWPTPLLDR